MHPLARVEAKLTRAEAESDRLGRETTRVLNLRPDEFYRLVPDFDLQASECRFRMAKVSEPPLREWEPMLGEIFHDLRSALDQLAYQLAILHEPTKDPPPGTEFPIFLHRKKFWAQGKGSGTYKTRGISPTVQAAIEKLQPYDTPEHPLWVLQQLSNSDKHRLGVIVDAEVAHPIVVGPYWRDAIEVSSQWERGPYEDGMDIVTYRLRELGPNPGVEMQFKPTLPISIDEGIGRPPRLLAQVMRDLTSTVKEIVGLFRPEFPP